MNLDSHAGHMTERQLPPPSTREPFRFIPASELLANLKAPDWHIRKYLESDSLGVLYGPPETGKSFVTIDWACCIATGTEWRGNRVKAGPVLVIIGEGRNGYARRLAAWAKANETSLQGAPLHVSNMATQLTDPTASIELGAVVAEFARTYGDPVLIVVDTLARNFGPGDENSSRDMQAAIATCDLLRDATKASVVLVHHVGKDASRGARGSGALLGAVDCEYSVTREADGLLPFESTKMKEASRPDALAFRFETVDLGFADEDGEPVTSAVLIDADPPSGGTASRGNGLGAAQRRILKTLVDEYERCRSNLEKSGRSPGNALVETERWKALLKVEGHHRQVVSKAIKALTDRGLVVIDGYHAIPGVGE